MIYLKITRIPWYLWDTSEEFTPALKYFWKTEAGNDNAHIQYHIHVLHNTLVKHVALINSQTYIFPEHPLRLVQKRSTQNNMIYQWFALVNLPPPSVALLLHCVGLVLISQLSLRVGCHTDLWLQICSLLKDTESRKTMFLRSPFSERTSVSHYGPQTLHYSLVWVKILFAHVYYDKSSFWLVAWSNLIRASHLPSGNLT